MKPNLFREIQRQKSASDEMVKLRYDFINFKKVFQELKNKIIEKNLFDILKLNDFSIMFVAQHYGFLTPILDWTTDPLTALFFAIDSYVLNDQEYPVVYILKTKLNNKSIAFTGGEKGPIPIDSMSNEVFEDLTNNLNSGIGHIPIAMFSGKNFSYRIAKQSGKFTLHQAVGPISWKWNDTVIEGDKIVDSIKINPMAIKEMKEYLLALNITKETICTERLELDNICNSMKMEALEKFKEEVKEMNEKLK